MLIPMQQPTLILRRGYRIYLRPVVLLYLKVMAREKVGSFSSSESLQGWLQDWILQYVDGDPENSTEATKARKPLAHAEVVEKKLKVIQDFILPSFICVRIISWKE